MIARRKAIIAGAGILCSFGTRKDVLGHVNQVIRDSDGIATHVVATVTREPTPVTIPIEAVHVLRSRRPSAVAKIAGQDRNGKDVRVGSRVILPTPGKPAGTVVLVTIGSRQLRPGFVEVEMPECADMGNVYDKMARMVCELEFQGDASLPGARRAKATVADRLDAILLVERKFHISELEVVLNP